MFKNIQTVAELNELHISTNKGELVMTRDAILDMSNCAVRLMKETNDENEISVLYAIISNCQMSLNNQFQL